MANFAAQIKDKFLGLVDRVAGCGRAGAGKDVQEPIKLHTVQVYRYPHASSIDLLVVSNTSCIHPVELMPPFLCCWIISCCSALRSGPERGDNPTVPDGSHAGVN